MQVSCMYHETNSLMGLCFDERRTGQMQTHACDVLPLRPHLVILLNVDTCALASHLWVAD
jgi:hypothetical protein